MLALGSFLILIQLICIKSEIKSDLGDLAIKIVNTRAAEVPQINSDDFMNGLFTKIESSIGSDKAVTVGYKKKRFETSENAEYSSIMNGGNPESYSMQREARIALKAYAEVSASKDYNKKSAYKMPENRCKNPYTSYKCDEYNPWRRIDGSCNNLQKPWWGASNTPYQRFAEPAYDDGIDSPRTRSIDGGYLPNPRKIALYVHSPYQSVSDWSHMFLWFGQFVLHDVTKIASIVLDYGKQKWCRCGWNDDPDCFNIAIPKEDYWNRDQECFGFTRSSPAVKHYDCELSPREQLNLVTSWVDLSVVYGSDESFGKQIRTYKHGLLKTSYNKYSKREHLPYRKGVETCLGLEAREKCSYAGDGRHEDNGFINAIHTIFVREHNRVARKLLYWNPYWDDETTFQEARRLVIAEYQNIVYAEFLPLLVGQKVARQFDLIPNEDGYFMGHDPKEDPSTYNEFAVAAARYGHTLVKNFQVRANRKYEIYDNNTVDYFLFNPELPEYGGGLDSLVRGSLDDWSYYPTSQVNDRLNNWLGQDLFFKESGVKRFSLPALNIQRGRDHGLQPYVVYREVCGLSRPYSFDDLTNMPKDVVEQLRKVYKSVEDIDLWTGMVSEYHLKDAIVGPTQACILAKGFRDWKYADRWWFENGNENKIKFTAPQLDEIRSTSFARIICDNVDVNYVQELAFLWPNEKYNPWTDCKKIAGIDFSKWVEKKRY